MTIAPPKILDLDWNVGSINATAAATDAFWPLYREQKQALRRHGITVQRSGDDWQVVFKPTGADIGTSIELMLLEHQDAEAARAERMRMAQESMDAMAASRAAADAEFKRRHAEILAQRMGPAVETARQLLIRFGEFVDRKDKVRAIVERFDDPDALPLGINDLNVLEDAIQSTKNKNSRTLLRALRSAGGVDWTDDEVAEAIRLLTLRDADHAAVENKVGWNKPDSPLGHWCFAVLESNRDAALKLGRTLVGKYAETQLGRAA